MITNTLKTLIPVWFLFLISCKTYTMSREELYAQIHDAVPVNVNTTHAVSIIHNTYKANGVKEIHCYDKKGKPAIILNSPRVEMRIKAAHNKSYTFYFDTIILQDSTFTGMNSRIMGTHRSVQFAAIKSVQLQQGAKKFNYSN